MIPPTCRVLREGSITSIPAENLVNGDVVLLRMGDKTPADCIVFSANDLKVDNSSLTGESEPQERRPLVDGAAGRAVEAENLVIWHFNPRIMERLIELWRRYSIRPLSSPVKDGVLLYGLGIKLSSVRLYMYIKVTFLLTYNHVGQIAKLTGEESDNTSPLAREM